MSQFTIDQKFFSIWTIKGSWFSGHNLRTSFPDSGRTHSIEKNKRVKEKGKTN